MAPTVTRNAVSTMTPIGPPSSPISVYHTPTATASSSQPLVQRQRAPIVPPQEIQLPRLFDIFDAPVYLRREQAKFSSSGSSTLPSSPSPLSAPLNRPLSDVWPSNPRVASSSRPRVCPLPQPIIFDGPSRAPPSWHYPPPLDTPRLPSTQAAADQKIGVLKVFDGPSRPHRRRISPPPRSKAAGPPRHKALFAGTLAIGAAAGAGFLISTQ